MSKANINTRARAAAKFEPAYLRLYESGELQDRVEQAVAMLQSCQVCPRDCKVNRLENKTAACHTGRYAIVGSHFPHFGEEDCLRGWNGSGTIFFSMCNLRCVFCTVPETLIPTDQGLKRIADLFEQAENEIEWHGGRIRFINDGHTSAVTRSGTLAPVAKVFRHHFAGDLMRIKPYNCPPLLLTPNHEVFAIPKTELSCVVKVRVDRLTTDDYLMVPKRVPSGIKIGLTGRQHLRWKETEEHFLVPVHKIERVPYDGPVFNLEIDDPDHSYLAPFVAVSNCQNYDISQAGRGREVRPEELAAMMIELQEQGCHNINFVTPEHVVPQIIEALPIAIRRGLRLPIVYNTSAYDSLDSLHLMDGVVDIYMPDFKFWESKLSLRYVIAKDYAEAARRAIKEMHRQVGDLVLDEQGLAKRGLMIRHLVMPGGIAGTREIMRFIAQEISPNTYVNIMAQYYPAGKVSQEKYAEINRRITQEEYEEAVRIAHEEGLFRLDPRELDYHRWSRWN